MKIKMTVLFVVSVFCLCVLLAHAQEPYFPIEVKSSKGISYISGGIGTDERRALEDMGKDYSLKLMFAAKGGAYVAMVNVDITNKKEKSIFSAVSRGPWLYADMPPGEYVVSAKYKGYSLQKEATVRTSDQTEIRFFWEKY